MRTRKTERNLKNREKSRINNQSVGGIKKPPLRYNDIAKEVCYMKDKFISRVGLALLQIMCKVQNTV